MAGRIAHLAIVLLLVSAGTFYLTEVAPGDPAVAILGPNATPDQYDRVEAERVETEDPWVTDDGREAGR